jgi:tetratricopeptide (TPR) repeat protein
MVLYDAFISYSHARDKPIAVLLQSIVQKLGKPWYRRRSLRLFRDDTSLSATPRLWPSIEQALSQSRYLILLASPEAAFSRWVDKELAYWLSHKGIDRLLIGLTSGELLWEEAVADFIWDKRTPLPPALTGQFPTEPKWVDLRAYRDGASLHDAKFTELCAEFAATIRGIPREDLLSQEVRQQRRALRLAWSATACVVIFAVAAATFAAIAVAQRDRAENTLTAATRSANDLVMKVAVRIRQTTGIPIDLVRDILDRAKDLQDQLIKYNESNSDLRRSQAVALRETSQTLLIQGAAEDALQSALKSLEVMNSLVGVDPANPELQLELSRSYNRIGEALSKLGHHDQALEMFEKSVAIGEKLITTGSDNETERDLAFSYERLGDELFDLDMREEALQAYQNSFVFRERLASSDPDNLLWQADLAISYERIGRTFEGQPDQALEAYRKSLSVWEKLVLIEPLNTTWQRNLAATLDSVGTILVASDRREEAIAAFRKGLKIREKLAVGNPDIPQWKVNIVISLVKLAEANDTPKERYTRALVILRRLAFEKKLTADQIHWLEDIERRIAALDQQ